MAKQLQFTKKKKPKTKNDFKIFEAKTTEAMLRQSDFFVY